MDSPTNGGEIGDDGSELPVQRIWTGDTLVLYWMPSKQDTESRFLEGAFSASSYLHGISTERKVHLLHVLDSPTTTKLNEDLGFQKPHE